MAMRRAARVRHRRANEGKAVMGVVWRWIRECSLEQWAWLARGQMGCNAYIVNESCAKRSMACPVVSLIQGASPMPPTPNDNRDS